MSQEASGLKEDRKKVFKRAFLMASGTLSSRILGLLRDMAMAALFDRAVTDAWTAAFRLPNLFRRLLGEGSLSVGVIPVFLEAKGADSEGIRARNLINGMYTFLLLTLGVLTILGIVYAEEVFRLLLSEQFSLMTAKWEMTVRLGRIMFGFVFFVCMYAYFMGVLNALGSFAVPAMAPALLNISMLAFTFLPAHWFSQLGDGLAWGVLVGGLLQAVLLWMALRAHDYLPRIQLNIWSADVRRVLRRILPGVLGLGLLQFSTLVNLYYASSLQEGAVSYIYWADRLLELPLSLISVSLGVASLPTLSALASKKDWVSFRNTGQDSFLMTAFLAWPSALGLFFLADDIVRVLFYRGQFTSQDALVTTSILEVYASGLVVISMSRVLMPLFYAVQRAWFPAIAAVICLLAHVSLAPVLMKEQGVAGLVTSSMASAALNMLLLLLGLQFWQLSFNWLKVSRELIKMAMSGMGMIFVLQACQWAALQMKQGQNVLTLFVTIVVSAVAYFGFTAVLRSEEWPKIRSLFRL